MFIFSVPSGKMDDSIGGYVSGLLGTICGAIIAILGAIVTQQFFEGKAEKKRMRNRVI